MNRKTSETIIIIILTFFSVLVFLRLVVSSSGCTGSSELLLWTSQSGASLAGPWFPSPGVPPPWICPLSSLLVNHWKISDKYFKDKRAYFSQKAFSTVLDETLYMWFKTTLLVRLVVLNYFIECILEHINIIYGSEVRGSRTVIYSLINTYCKKVQNKKNHIKNNFIWH